jgi:hypothetical protein
MCAEGSRCRTVVSPLRKKREGWGTRMLVAGGEETLVGSFRAAFEETFVERLPALEPSLYGVPEINFCFA